jgi:zinc/manganese transport system permease protein
MARARGVDVQVMSIVFGLILACATTMSVPIVGALLMFALLVGPPAAARFVTDRPLIAIPLSVALALATVWGAIALAYATDWPVGFFVTSISAALYLAGRLAAGVLRGQRTAFGGAFTAYGRRRRSVA